MSAWNIKMNIRLLLHNQAAYDAALTLMKKTGKAAIIHPTGTGKSFIGFKLCQEHPQSVVLWLSPSDYIFQMQLQNLRKAAGGYDPENILFFTYAKLMLMQEWELEELSPDYIILDEFHRCGAAEWGKGVERLLRMYGEAKVLGLSATNVRYLDNQRDMADELFDGNVASEMTLGEAIARGILLPPTYVISVYSYQKELERYERRIKNTQNKAARAAAMKYLEALRRALEKADGLDVVFQTHIKNRAGKFLVFCANQEHMNEMRGNVGEWFGKVDPCPHLYSVYAEDPASKEELARFQADDSEHLKLLFCIDMLNEGIHVEDLDGVILLRPTVSPIIYKQQIGRALSASKKKEPFIFDIVNNFENLYSVGSIEEEMQEFITYYKRSEQGAKIVNEGFSIYDEVRDCRELFRQLEDTLAASWHLMFAEAKTYFETFGNLDVPTQYKTQSGLALGAWIYTQRAVYRGKAKGRLTSAQVEKLEGIGMIWDNRLEALWNRNYDLARNYYNIHGDLDIPSDWRTFDGEHLGKWLAKQRMDHSKGILSSERKRQLDAIGMIWSRADYGWEEKYLKAMKYYVEHGNLDVPRQYRCEDGFLLGVWVARQRSAWQQGALSDRRRQRLTEIGMIWESPRMRRWAQMLELCKAFQREHGHLDIPYEYRTEDKTALGQWLERQRYAYHFPEKVAYPLSKEQIGALEDLEIHWESQENWDRHYELARQFFEEKGHLRIPTDYTVRTQGQEFRIGGWLLLQKRIYRGKVPGKSLTQEQAQKLERIGVVWQSCRERLWEDGYQEALKYFSEKGHINVPRRYKTASGFELGVFLWQKKQREKEGKLSPEQKEKLDGLGMVWAAGGWERMYRLAEEYYEANGNLDIPTTWKAADGSSLGRWISRMRKEYQAGTLDNVRIDKLNQIGMVWEPLAERIWNTGYDAARAFYEHNGHLRVWAKYVDSNGYPLGTWLSAQRRLYQKGTLAQSKINRLNRIGMNWEGTGNQVGVALGHQVRKQEEWASHTGG